MLVAAAAADPAVAAPVKEATATTMTTTLAPTVILHWRQQMTEEGTATMTTATLVPVVTL